MNAAALLLASAFVGAGYLPIDGDTLVYSNGAKSKGTVIEVSFVAEGETTVYQRDALAALALSGSGSDVLLLRPGGPRKGKVTSVQFQAAKGAAVAVAREKLRSVVLSATHPSAPKPSETPESPELSPTKDEPKLSDEEKGARTKELKACWALRNKYWDKTAELNKKDYDALKSAWMGDCARVQNQIDSARRAIDDKLRRRREADAQWRRDCDRARRNSKEGQRYRQPPRPSHNDGLENDRRTLREAEAAKSKLQRIISREKSKLSASLTLTRRRVESIYAKFKKAIGAGETFTADEMHKRYQAALDAHPAYQKGR